MSRSRALVDRFYATARWPLRTQLLVAGLTVGAVFLVVALGSSRNDQKSRSSTLGATTTSVGPATGSATIIRVAESTGESSLVSTPANDEGLTTSAPLPATAENPLPATTLAMTDVDALLLIASIPVEKEHRGGYDRDFFAVWSDLDKDGCDTRAEVLKAESLVSPQIGSDGCDVVAGDWLSSYDGVRTSDPSHIDIDHVVSLKEAWDSGAWAWVPERRIAFGNDASDGRTLNAVSAGSNLAKGEADPSNWLPIDDAVCQYLSNWISIKARWSLLMDESEIGRIRNLLKGDCQGTTVPAWPPTPG